MENVWPLKENLATSLIEGEKDKKIDDHCLNWTILDPFLTFTSPFCSCVSIGMLATEADQLNGGE